MGVVFVVVVAVGVAARVGPGFGVEGGFNFVHVAAEVFDHGLDDVVAADADAVAQ